MIRNNNTPEIDEAIIMKTTDRSINKVTRNRRFLTVATAGIVTATLLSACGGQNEVHADSQTDKVITQIHKMQELFKIKDLVNPVTEGLVNPTTKLRAAKIISTFENSTTEIQYAYAENIKDGRGITAGRAGFTSATGDLLLVVQEYASEAPDSDLAKYLPALIKVNGTDSMEGLEGFVKIWAKTAQTDKLLRDKQDEVADKLYFEPAMKQAKKLGIRSTLGQLIIWDTIIQHGEGEDPDGLPAIIKETTDKIGIVKDNEASWLDQFLIIRQQHLENAADPDTREGWKESVDRVKVLRSFLQSGNMTLNLPLEWTVYGDKFTLKS